MFMEPDNLSRFKTSKPISSEVFKIKFYISIQYPVNNDFCPFTYHTTITKSHLRAKQNY